MEYANHSRLAIGDATAENAIRPVAVSPKNWLFGGSERGGHTAAMLISLLATCQQHGVPLAMALARARTRATDRPGGQPIPPPFNFTKRFPL